jgi:hypothetical protein
LFTLQNIPSSSPLENVLSATLQGNVILLSKVQFACRAVGESGFATPTFAAASSAIAAMMTNVRKRVLHFMSNSLWVIRFGTAFRVDEE